MSQRVVVDPVTRIEGHLRMEAIVDNGVITDAFSSSTMVRGIEIIVKDRDPRDVWAFVMRVCGVCTSMHGLASVRAIENTLGIVVPPNAEMIRNIMLAALTCQDHLTHFYQLQAMDWVDIVSALSASPKEASSIAQSINPLNNKYSAWGDNSPGYFADVQKKVKKFIEVNPDNNMFSPKRWCWGSKSYKLPAAVNLIGLAHYLSALEFQKEIVKIQTVFGGKNPHPNYLVGGMACAINMSGPNAINIERLNLVGKIIQETQNFMNEVYLPDVLAILAFYPEWTRIGGGLRNYLSYGDYPTAHYGDVYSYKAKRGIVLNRDLSHVEPFDPDSLDGLQEFVNNSWYKYSVGKDKGLHPSIGETILDYTGPTEKYDWLGAEKPYSWVKTPRYKGMPMEVGSLARIAVNYASKDERVVDDVEKSLSRLKENVKAFTNKTPELSLDSLWSTAGRTLARSIEATEVADYGAEFFNQLINNINGGDTRTFNNEKWSPDRWDPDCMGYSLNEAPRGALAHYAHVRNQKVFNYQMVVPTTWNASPRDPMGQKSAFEASVIGTPVGSMDPKGGEMALNIIRTLHSFDPCMSCSVHLYDEKGDFIHQIDVENK